MRIDKIIVRGVTRFPEDHDVQVDLASLGPGLVAFVGPNGSGKTSLLEAAFAGIHLEFPTRPGGLYGVCHGKNAMIGLKITDEDDSITTKVDVDAVNQRTSASLWINNEKKIGGKVRDYKSFVASRLGSPRLMLAAMVSAQTRRGNLLELPKADRKELLMEILDTQGLQQIAEAAKERRKAAETTLDELRGKVAALEEQKAELESRYSTDYAEELLKNEIALEKELYNIRETIETVRGQVEATKKQIEELKRTEERLEELTAALLEAGKVKRAAESSVSYTEEKLAEALESAQEYMEEDGDLADDSNRLKELIQEHRDAILAIKEELADLSNEAGEMQQRETSTRLAIGEVELRLSDAEEKAALLKNVPCAGEGEYESCPLLQDAISANGAIMELQETLQGRQELLETIQGKITELTSRAKQMKEDLTEHQTALDQLTEQLRACEVAKERRAAAKRAAEYVETLQEKLESERVRLKSAEDAVKKAQAEVDALDFDPVYMEELELELADKELELERLAEKDADLVRKLKAAGAEMHAHEERQRIIGKLGASIKEYRGSLGGYERTVEVYSILERAFGRDGIQALEIDAAGPELSRLVTELLHSCFGPRFDVVFVTQAAKKSGGMKEVFDIQVIDHERGREGSVESLSGGEKTIISEAISLALAVYSGRNSGHHFETLFRDETAGQLDPENATRYVTMLRKAMQMAGAHQVVFIAQQPEVWGMADAVVRVEEL